MATGPAARRSTPMRTARQRRRRCDWAFDIDIKAFIDSIDRALLLRAVRRHADCPWALLYVERWLKAPMQREDGAVEPRDAGTPQGGVISPILANLFLHYAFDMGMARTWPAVQFERYADDAICHCRTRDEAEASRGRTARALRGLPTGASSAEDENRLLQGHQPEGDAPWRDIRLSRLFVSAEAGGVARRQIRRLVPAGSR